VRHGLNVPQLLQMRRRISARAVCKLQGSATKMPLCGKLWVQNADEVSQKRLRFFKSQLIFLSLFARFLLVFGSLHLPFSD
jgi:hypothetical protein